MRIKYYGVRGSIPVTGKDFNKYGGSTTCVTVTDANTTLVIDTGTGMRNFGKDLMKISPVGHKIHVLMTHYHWDHLMGFPFFTPAFIKGNEINFYGETKYNLSVQDVFKKQQQFINFPIELSGMAAKIHFTEIQDNDEINIGPFKVITAKLNHPAGTLGFRIQSGESVFVVATDVEHYAVPDNKLIKLAKDAGILMYDAQFTPEEYPKYIGWGHSTYEEGIKVAQLSGAKEVHLCHHAPEHTDDQIDNIQMMAQARFPKAFAVKEGMEVEI